MEIGLWKNQPDLFPGRTDCLERIYSSARSAIRQILREERVGRLDFAVVPERASGCLIGTVGRVAQPVPISFLELNSEISPRVFILVDQWGWVRPETAREEVRGLYPNALKIWDRVDVLCQDLESYLKFAIQKGEYQVVSLSKLVGLNFGALTWDSEGLCRLLQAELGDEDEKRHFRALQDSDVTWSTHFLKENFSILPEEVVSWLQTNDLEAAFSSEYQLRLERANRVGEVLQLNLPLWMKKALAEPLGVPGIFPILVESRSDLQIMSKETQLPLYGFDYSETYLRPEWKPGLALPLHSGMSEGDFEDKLSQIHTFRQREGRG